MELIAAPIFYEKVTVKYRGCNQLHHFINLYTITKLIGTVATNYSNNFERHFCKGHVKYIYSYNLSKKCKNLV